MSGDGLARGRDLWTTGWPWLQLAMLALLCLFVYRGALGGGFLSDDVIVIVENPLVNDPSPRNLLAMWDPSGPVIHAGGGNYAPVHLLLTTLERQLFGDQVMAYHVVNVLVHALNAVLLAAALMASGIGSAGALAGGLLFAVHPANVEAVAWIFQLKTNVALAFSLAALLLLPRRPLLATVLFALGLLTKASALFVLPMAAALAWGRRGAADRPPISWRWIGVWALVFLVYAVPAFGAFERYGAAEGGAYPDRGVQLRSVAAIGARYLAMAASSYGVSAFQQPAAAHSWLDPWWLAALFVGGLLIGRTAATLRHGSDEAAWWIAALAGFAPISQIFPFKYPVADRYLYFILPGLIGGALFALRGLGARLGGSRVLATRAAPRWLPIGALALGAALALVFGVRSEARARLWRNPTLVFLDAARNYPDGVPARILGARRAAQMGDVDGVLAALRAAREKGYDRFMELTEDPALQPVLHAPAFVAFIREMAGEHIERFGDRPGLTQGQHHLLAHAYLLRDDPRNAALAFAEAIRAPGPQQEILASELAGLLAQHPELRALVAGGEGQ